jgi:hypothetical protein
MEMFRTYFDNLPPLLNTQELEQLIFRDSQLVDKILQGGHLEPAELPTSGNPLFWREDVYRVLIELQSETLFDS